MLQLLETGQALYVLAAICLLGIMTRAITKHLYKRLLKESGNLTLTKNKSLKDLRQKAENTYRMNQGLRDSGAWLEHQLYDLKVMGMTLSGWSNLSMQWTWLCLLAGGAGAFFSYWYRLDTYYIVMYGGGAVLMAMLTMLFDNGMNSGWREQLVASLQDYLENVMCPRLARNLPVEAGRGEAVSAERPGLRGVGRLASHGDRSDRLAAQSGRGARLGRSAQTQEAAESELEDGKEEGFAGTGVAMAGSVGAARAEFAGNGSAGGCAGKGPGGKKRTAPGGRRSGPKEPAAVLAAQEQEGRRDIDYLKHSLEQIAASREKARTADGNWLKDLGPEEVELIGDILKQYLA